MGQLVHVREGDGALLPCKEGPIEPKVLREDFPNEHNWIALVVTEITPEGKSVELVKYYQPRRFRRRFVGALPLHCCVVCKEEEEPSGEILRYASIEGCRDDDRMVAKLLRHLRFSGIIRGCQLYSRYQEEESDLLAAD